MKVEGRWIKDELCRTTILRGVNLSQWSKKPPFEPFDESKISELDRIKRLGFNCVRFLTFWEAIEPQKGIYDYDYLGRLDRWIGMLEEREIYVIIDMHQDVYSSVFCNGNGAPEWASLTEFGEPDCSSAMSAYHSDSVKYSFDNFWRSEELQNHYIDSFKEIAERYSESRFVIGYDLFNEPWHGSLSPFVSEFELSYLKPFYEKLIEGLREVDPDCLIFFEPRLVVGGGLRTFLDEFDADGLIYAPHYYDPMVKWGTIPYDGDDSRMQKAFGIFEEQSQQQLGGIPWFVGEWGIILSGVNTEAYVSDQCELFERYMVGYAYWNYNIMEDDLMSPVTPYGDERRVTDADGNETVTALDIMCRPYPMKTAGLLIEFNYNKEEREFYIRFEEDGEAEGDTEIYIPADRIYPNGFKVTVSDGEFNFIESENLLIYRHDPRKKIHELRISSE
jgi:endoglycosylceramidase